LDGAIFKNLSLFDDVRQLTLKEDKDFSFPSLEFLKGCSKIEVLVIKQHKSMDYLLNGIVGIPSQTLRKLVIEVIDLD
jgi:hypothetical protein